MVVIVTTLTVQVGDWKLCSLCKSSAAIMTEKETDTYLAVHTKPERKLSRGTARAVASPKSGLAFV